ncbi:MAG: acryloyl-CoA reductase [Alphaproteobacteria bacterium]|nr:acryloyl-CoA reductase [Alphaproteobacteria bacterium]
MMAGTFQAFRVEAHGEAGRGRIADMTLDELSAGDVLVRTLYAGVNYKDALAGTGQGRIVRRYPSVGGIEAVGVVEEVSDNPSVAEGTTVILHGYGLGVERDGGFSPWVRVTADMVTPLPEGLEPLAAAGIGVAGHTIAVALDLLELNGLKPENGPVAVTGATGGTGSLAVSMLAAQGYDVVAVSRKSAAERYLKSIGAKAVIPPPEETSARPLESARWAGAIDATGGRILEWLIRTMKPNGVVAAFGNAAGLELNTTVLPFILRGVRLIGVNADTRPPYRGAVWQRLATDLNPRFMDDMLRVVRLEELPAVMESMVAGTTQGRTLVQFNRD